MDRVGRRLHRLLPEDEAIQGETKAKLQEALSRLPPRQRQVLELRFGFVWGPPRSLEEVGTRLGVSRERVRQIEGEALERLRRLLNAEAG